MCRTGIASTAVRRSMLPNERAIIPRCGVHGGGCGTDAALGQMGLLNTNVLSVSTKPCWTGGRGGGGRRRRNKRGGHKPGM
jgi:hypothetical protein